MDVGIQKPFKDALRAVFAAYIMALHMNIIKDGVPPDDQTVDLRISVLKPLLPMFLAHAFKRISEDRILVKNAWEKAGILQCFNTDFQREAVRLAFAGQLYPADEQPPLVADNGPGPYDTLENDDDVAAEELQQQLQELHSVPEGTHAEILQPDWAQDVSRAAVRPGGTRIERDMIAHAVGQEAAKKPLPLRAAKGKKKTAGKRRKVTEPREAVEPKRPRGRPKNAERLRRAATTSTTTTVLVIPDVIDEAGP